MAIPFAPHAQTVKVRHIPTGQVTELWPVDARERASFPKEYEYVVEGQPEAPKMVPAETAESPLDQRLAARAKLELKSYAELKALAKKAGIVGNLASKDLIEAIIPHVIGGTVSLDPVPHFTLPHPQFPSAAEV